MGGHRVTTPPTVNCEHPFIHTCMFFISHYHNCYNGKIVTGSSSLEISVTKKFKKISKGNLPNVGMGGWMETLADKVHKQGDHIHPPIPTFGRFLLEIVLNFLFLLFLLRGTATHLRLMRHSRTYTDEWRPATSTLCSHDRKALELCRSYAAQNKAQKHYPQRIPWWLRFAALK